MRTLKKIISRYMQIITVILVAVMLMIIVGIQITNEQRRARESATRTFYQMEQVLAQNQQELTELKDEYKQTCLHNAEAIAYMIEEKPEILDRVDELQKIAEFMEVDEIHIFDSDGCIFAGTQPQYFGYSFDSGEQMMFFKPMLTDKSLRLVQEIVPNTAAEKLMQYSALWSSNGEFIVQVGMEPVSVLKVTEKNELSHIFSLFRVNPEADYYAVDAQSGEIVGATDLEWVTKNVKEIGLELEDIRAGECGFHTSINGERCYCVFKQVGTNYIGRVIANKQLYQRIPPTVIIIGICFFIIAVILVKVVTQCMTRYVVEGIYEVNEKLRLIAKGNLKETVAVYNSVEFTELSSHINEMIRSLLSSNRKMSYVLSKTNMYIGIYEYHENMEKVRYTEYVPKILSVDVVELEQLASDYKTFKEFIEKIQQNPVADEQGIFKLSKTERYVRLEEINDNDEIFGVVIDVTDEINRRRKIEVERDVDSLTGLYNRRGLDIKLSILFSEPEKLGYSALIMIDADGLKIINDTYGHEKGDIYLKKIAGIINHFGLRSSVAARQGGDEFVLFLYHYDAQEELNNTIKTLEYIQNHSTAHLDDDLMVPLRFSFGYSLVNGRSDYQTLLKEADEKMYANKRERKKM